MIIERKIANCAKLIASQYPCLVLTGPRQSGKSTLATHLFKDKAYINLEDPNVRLRAEEDPLSLFNEYPDGCIFDEIQRVPTLLSYIQTIADKKQQAGQFILTGSHQPLLQQGISQSLAGRAGILTLLPLSISELRQNNSPLITDELLFKGFYPAIYKNNLAANQYYSYYNQTYLERDIRDISRLHDLTRFQQFMRLCASRIGQTLNMSNFSNDLGVSVPTIKSWLTILEACYIIFRLPPYFENVGKRITKSPKLYFYDTGLATHLLGIETCEQIKRDPLRGSLFENMVVSDMIKSRFNDGKVANLFYYRDNAQHEVDLILKQGSSLHAYEIKSAMTYHSRFKKELEYFKSLTKEQFSSGTIIYDGQSQQRSDFNICNYQEISS